MSECENCTRLRAENERLTRRVAELTRQSDIVDGQYQNLEARADTATRALSDLRARIENPDEAMVALVRNAARDEYGSALCAWIDMQTQRACAINVLPYKCRCEAVGRAVLAALSKEGEDK